MKRILAVFVFCLAVCAYPAVQKGASRITLDLGSVTVWLGMSKAEFLGAIASAGYRVVLDNGKDGSVMISSGSPGAGHYYTVRFSSGRLTYAERSWFSDEEKPFQAVLGALATVSGQHCTVQDDPKHTPEINLSRIYIYCQSRSILILSGMAGKDQISDVFERIGSD